MPSEEVGAPLVPPVFAADLISHNGPAAAGWVEGLPGLVAAACRRWSLTIDGSSMHGAAGLVVLVRSATDEPAVLKVSWPHDEAVHEAAALRAWDGTAAVRLLADDADNWCLLLERLDSTTTLESMADDDAAVQLAAELLPRLHVPAPAGLPTVTDLAARWMDELPAENDSLGQPVSPRLLDQVLASCDTIGPDGPTVLLHGDFHYANVLAGRREAWLAIDPKPLAGPPEFDVAPLLRNRWPDLVAAGDVAGALRRRFDHIVETAGLDRERAQAWVVTRAIDNVLWATARHDTGLAVREHAIASHLSRSTGT